MPDAVEITLEYSAGQNAAPEDLDAATFRMYRALMDQDFVRSVKRPTGAAEAGAKGDPITLGALAISVLPAFLPKLVEFAAEWVKARPGHTIKFKGTISGQAVEFEGTVSDLEQVLKLGNGPQAAAT